MRCFHAHLYENIFTLHLPYTHFWWPKFLYAYHNSTMVHKITISRHCYHQISTSWTTLCMNNHCTYTWLHSNCTFHQTMKGKWLKSTFCQGLYSLSGNTSYRQISWSLEATRLGVIRIVMLWNLTGVSAALLPRCLSNFRVVEKV